MNNNKGDSNPDNDGIRLTANPQAHHDVKQNEYDNRRNADRHLGQRSRRFFRMQSIFFAVEKIIKNVDAAGNETKTDDGKQAIYT